MTWAQTGWLTLMLGITFYFLWRLWSRPDPMFDQARKRDEALRTLRGWDTDTAPVRPSVIVLPRDED